MQILRFRLHNLFKVTVTRKITNKVTINDKKSKKGKVTAVRSDREKRSQTLKTIQMTIFAKMREALLDYGVTPNLLSERLT